MPASLFFHATLGNVHPLAKWRQRFEMQSASIFTFSLKTFQ